VGGGNVELRGLARPSAEIIRSQFNAKAQRGGAARFTAEAAEVFAKGRKELEFSAGLGANLSGLCGKAILATKDDSDRWHRKGTEAQSKIARSKRGRRATLGSPNGDNQDSQQGFSKPWQLLQLGGFALKVFCMFSV
jgi:hypothetical protein